MQQISAFTLQPIANPLNYGTFINLLVTEEASRMDELHGIAASVFFFFFFSQFALLTNYFYYLHSNWL